MCISLTLNYLVIIKQTNMYVCRMQRQLEKTQRKGR